LIPTVGTRVETRDKRVNEQPSSNRETSMKKLILEEWLSLDGFAVDKDGNLDFFPASETDKFSDRDQLEFLNTVDTILLGRKTYELFVDFWPTAPRTAYCRREQSVNNFVPITGHSRGSPPSDIHEEPARPSTCIRRGNPQRSSGFRQFPS
jgi:hypothetical protein